MKTICCLAAVLAFSLGLCPAADVYWIGPADGTWENGANWSGGKKPTNTDHVIVTNESEVAISNSDHSMNFTRLTVRAGTLKLTTSGGMYFSGDASGTCRVEVAEGAVLKIGSMARCQGGAVLAKTGPGRMVCDGGYLGNATYKYPCVDVREGELRFAYRYGPVTADMIKVRSGARLLIRDYDVSTTGGVVVDVERGGTFELGGKSVKVAAVTGEGTVVAGYDSSLSATLTMTLAGGPYRFGGVFSGNVDVVFAPDPFSAGESVLTVASPTAFAECALPVTTDAAGIAAMLRFADGIGRVAVAIADGLPSENFLYEDGTSVAWSRYLAAGRTYTHTADGDDHWTTPVFGEGTIVEKSSGIWTIDSLSLTGGTFTVSENATGNAVVFGGGVCVDTKLQMNRSDGYEYRFEGISWPVDSTLCAYSRIVRQTGGYVRFLPASAARGTTETDDGEFLFVSGGTFVSRADDYYQQGFGMEASGTAYVRLEDGEYGTHSVVYNKKPINRALRISDDAVVYADNLNMCYHTGSSATATVSVAGRGLLEIGGTIGSLDNKKPVDSFCGRLVFDGGTIRSTAAGDVTWPTSLFADKDFMTEVLSGGMTVDVPQTDGARTLTWTKPIAGGVAGGTDGGFAKTGAGALALGGALTVTGPIAVSGGLLSVAGTGDAAVGTGPVSIENATLKFSGDEDARLAHDAGTAVTYKGNVGLVVQEPYVTLDIGTAATSCAFDRVARGILTIAPGGVPTSISNAEHGLGDGFAKRTVRVHGGVETNRCGVIGGGVFGWLWGSLVDLWGYNRYATELRLLCVGEGGVLDVPRPAVTNAVPDGADETTVAIFSRPRETVVLGNDAHVGALEVCGNALSIASGVTLTVGEGAGSVAPVTLNNRYCLNGPDSARGRIGGGGTVDFGGAEGVIGVNAAYGYNDDVAARPAEITARIAGTGGMTFFSPAVAESKSVRALALSGANTYTGGTYAENVILLPRDARSFGSGPVELASSDGYGAQLLFDASFAGGVFTNALVVSGAGFRYDDAGDVLTGRWGLGGAVSAQGDVALAGGVTLAGDTTMFVADGATLTLASPVSGVGRLTLAGAGTLAIAAPVSCELLADGVGSVELRPGDGGELHLASRTVPDGSTLVVSACGEQDSCGTLVVEGDLDLSRIGIRFSENARFRGASFTLLRVTGMLSGEASGIALPGPEWSIVREDSSLIARRAVKGTVLIVK